MGWRWEKGGGGGPLFPTRQDDRTPDIVFRSLFGFGTVEFGIAAERLLLSCKLYISSLIYVY
jgi:hypothetical protein